MEMFKEAFICGLGMVIDLSGSHYFHSHNSPVIHNGIHADWKEVGGLFNHSMNTEGPKIKEEAAKQLYLKLG
jgi:hypothetical protein